MEKLIRHEGIVVAVNGSTIFVRIIQQSACAECHAHGICSASDMSEKIIEVNDKSHSFSQGDKVLLEGNLALGLNAVLLAFVVPFSLIILTLIIAYILTENDIISGLLSILVLLPYYYILYLKRDKLKRKFAFKIKHNLYHP